SRSLPFRSGTGSLELDIRILNDQSRCLALLFRDDFLRLRKHLTVDNMKSLGGIDLLLHLLSGRWVPPSYRESGGIRMAFRGLFEFRHVDCETLSTHQAVHLHHPAIFDPLG